MVEYLLYGLGGFFRENLQDGKLIEQIEKLGYHITGVVDKRLAGEMIAIGDNKYNVMSPLDIPSVTCDMIVLTTTTKDVTEDIICEMKNIVSGGYIRL